MPHLFSLIREDVTNVMDHDPAAKSRLEVFLCYSGLHAVWFQVVARFRAQGKLTPNVVIVGASERPGAWGKRVWNNLQRRFCGGTGARRAVWL